VIEQLHAQGQAQGFIFEVTTYNMPNLGLLRAIVLDGKKVFLSWELKGNTFDFDVYNAGSGWPGQPSYQLTFDLAVVIQIDIPESPGQQFTISSSPEVRNPHIGPTDFSASFIDFVGGFWNFIHDQPFNIFQSAEGQIGDAGGDIKVDTSTIATLLTALPGAWSEAIPFGFTILTALIRDNQLFLMFEHPLDQAPQVFNAAVDPFPSFFHPQISTDPEAKAGTTLTVLCSSFPLSQAQKLFVGWNDTTSGTPIASTVIHGPATGTQTPINITRSFPGPDTHNFFIADSLSPNTDYTFSVRDEDWFTETPFSAPVHIRTTATDEVDFSLSLGTQTWDVGSGTLTAVGTFNASVTLPASLGPGIYTLSAKIAGADVADTTIQIVGKDQQEVPLVWPLNHDNRITVQELQGAPLTLELLGFQAGDVGLWVDSPAGRHLATVNSTGPEQFQVVVEWPSYQDAPGFHNVFAQDVNREQLPATCTIDSNTVPQ
jgi:hypothetical protein